MKAIIIFFFSLGAFAQVPHFQSFPEIDFNMSRCMDTYYCTTISKVTETTNGSALASFSCENENGKHFNCSKLVDFYGYEIIGEKVKVSNEYYGRSHPGCHIIGGCLRCRLTNSYAELSNDC